MEFLLLMILLALCAILIAMPKSPLSAEEQCNRETDAWLARERLTRDPTSEERHEAWVRDMRRQIKRERLLRPLRWLGHKLRWVPPTIAGLMVSSIPIYFIGLALGLI